MITELSRRGAMIFASAALASLMVASPALADKTTEAFVQSNAQGVLNALAETKSAAERRATFSALMDKFADMPAVASFVLGKYARQARADLALYKDWVATFKEYGLVVYETQLDQYRGNAIKVLRSRDYDKNGVKRSLVLTEIAQKNGTPLRVDWDLQLYPNGAWKVVDVALKFSENSLSLVTQQQGDFLAQLDANGGDVRKLMDSVKAQTAKMRAAITR
ncbi:MAG TPA: ABC transporter substrate-binding protein [Caulobacterales bacterium]|nr:ABC transporter substrate-binding protein [Caulobacterales bacterium]